MKSTALCLATMACVISGAASAQTCAPLHILNSVTLLPVPGENTMMVPVTINGAPKRLLVSTGTQVGQVSAATVRELQLPEFEKIDFNQLRAVDARGAVKTDAARVRVSTTSFGMGSVNGSGIQFQIAADPELGKTKPYDGYLGIDLFKLYDLDMDFGAHRLNYFDPFHCPAQVVYWPHDSVAVVTMERVDDKIIVPVTIDGRSIDAVIDTGTSRTTMRRGIGESRFGAREGKDMVPVEGLRDSKDQQVFSHVFASLGFAGVTVKNLNVLLQNNKLVADPEADQMRLGSHATTKGSMPNLVIGMDVLSRLHMYVAFNEGKLYVTPAGTGESVLFKNAEPTK